MKAQGLIDTARTLVADDKGLLAMVRFGLRAADDPRLTWRFNHKLRSLPPEKILRIELMAPAAIHWTADNWKTCQDIKTLDGGLGIHLADLPTQSLPEDTQIKFTFYWPDAGHWEGKDFMVRVGSFHRDGTASAERSETDEKQS